MDGAALDEDGHENDNSDAHEEDSPPEFRDPLNDGMKGFLVEEKVLQSSQWALGIYFAALEEDVAIALEIVTWRSGAKAESFIEATDEAFGHEVYR